MQKRNQPKQPLKDRYKSACWGQAQLQIFKRLPVPADEHRARSLNHSEGQHNATFHSPRQHPMGLQSSCIAALPLVGSCAVLRPEPNSRKPN